MGQQTMASPNPLKAEGTQAKGLGGTGIVIIK
jgi:hypothetical protein